MAERLRELEHVGVDPGGALVVRNAQLEQPQHVVRITESGVGPAAQAGISGPFERVLGGDHVVDGVATASAPGQIDDPDRQRVRLPAGLVDRAGHGEALVHRGQRLVGIAGMVRGHATDILGGRQLVTGHAAELGADRVDLVRRDRVSA